MSRRPSPSYAQILLKTLLKSAGRRTESSVNANDPADCTIVVRSERVSADAPARNLDSRRTDYTCSSRASIIRRLINRSLTPTERH
jgi:hypothetical protein